VPGQHASVATTARVEPVLESASGTSATDVNAETFTADSGSEEDTHFLPAADALLPSTHCPISATGASRPSGRKLMPWSLPQVTHTANRTPSTSAASTGISPTVANAAVACAMQPNTSRNGHGSSAEESAVLLRSWRRSPRGVGRRTCRAVRRRSGRRQDGAVGNHDTAPQGSDSSRARSARPVFAR
jgi:hypothetical protein